MTARTPAAAIMRRRTPAHVFALTLAALWGMTLAAAGAGELTRLITPRLHLHPHSVPSPGAALTVWTNNMLIASWPLLVVALRMHRVRWRRQLGDIYIAGSLVVNSALVGAALAAGQDRILPYLPHLPLEWAAMALSSTSWLLASRDKLHGRQLAALATALAILLAVAALIETYAVPHL